MRFTGRMPNILPPLVLGSDDLMLFCVVFYLQHCSSSTHCQWVRPSDQPKVHPPHAAYQTFERHTALIAV
eukprot:5304818-Amphidinium_carterae.1